MSEINYYYKNPMLALTDDENTSINIKDVSNITRDQALIDLFEKIVFKDSGGQNIEATNSCQRCRKLKKKCTKHKPLCLNCFKTNYECVYLEKTNGVVNRHSSGRQYMNASSPSPGDANESPEGFAEVPGTPGTPVGPVATAVDSGDKKKVAGSTFINSTIESRSGASFKPVKVESDSRESSSSIGSVNGVNKNYGTPVKRHVAVSNVIINNGPVVVQQPKQQPQQSQPQPQQQPQQQLQPQPQPQPQQQPQPQRQPQPQPQQQPRVFQPQMQPAVFQPRTIQPKPASRPPPGHSQRSFYHYPYGEIIANIFPHSIDIFQEKTRQSLLHDFPTDSPAATSDDEEVDQGYDEDSEIEDDSRLDSIDPELVNVLVK